MEGAEQTLLQVPQRMLGMLDQAPVVRVVEQIVREGVRLCRETVDGRAKVALAVGPLTGGRLR